MLKVLVVAPRKSDTGLSYYRDWFEALIGYTGFQADVIHTESRTRLAFDLYKKRNQAYDLIFYPYGFFNRNGDRWRKSIFQLFSGVKGTKIFFLENEYRSLNRKLAYALSLDVDYVTTQIPKNIADRVYSAFLPPARIISLPHGLNPRVVTELAPRNGAHRREIDIDITGDPYPFYLGHQDRQELARYFSTIAETYGVRVAVNIGRGKRIDRASWIRHLFECKGVLHHEAGSDYLETNDSTRDKVNRYLSARGGATFEEVFDKFFKGYSNPVSGRALSSRHFEAIGTKTCQIMFPGRYNDILMADEHYIAIERDYSNIDDVMSRFQDVGYRQQMVDRAYEFAMDGHTHQHRINELLRYIGAA